MGVLFASAVAAAVRLPSCHRVLGDEYGYYRRHDIKIERVIGCAPEPGIDQTVVRFYLHIPYHGQMVWWLVSDGWVRDGKHIVCLDELATIGVPGPS
jgi:hypothetical protein